MACWTNVAVLTNIVIKWLRIFQHKSKKHPNDNSNLSAECVGIDCLLSTVQVCLQLRMMPSFWHFLSYMQLIHWAKTKWPPFPEDIFKCIFLNEGVQISVTISLMCIPKGQISNISALVQKMARRRPGEKPIFEPMIVSLPMNLCVALPQRIKGRKTGHAHLLANHSILFSTFDDNLNVAHSNLLYILKCMLLRN